MTPKPCSAGDPDRVEIPLSHPRLCSPSRLPGGRIHIPLFSAEHGAYVTALNAGWKASGGSPAIIPLARAAREKQNLYAEWSARWDDPAL